VIIKLGLILFLITNIAHTIPTQVDKKIYSLNTLNIKECHFTVLINDFDKLANGLDFSSDTKKVEAEVKYKDEVFEVSAINPKLGNREETVKKAIIQQLRLIFPSSF